MDAKMREMRDRLVGMMLDDDENKDLYPIGDELQKIRSEMVHIEGLKAGDKLRWKDKAYTDKRSEGNNGIFEVFRVFPAFLPGGEIGSNHQCDECDFSVVEIRNSTINEFAYDSRRFNRVTE